MREAVYNPQGVRWLALAAAILVLGPVGWIAGERGLAAVAAVMLQEHLDYWKTHPGAVGIESWGRAEDAFQFAHRNSPNDPHLLQQGGQLYVWRAGMGSDAVEREKSLDRAIELQRRSLQIRPAWPYAWMDFALAKAGRSALDREFQHAFATTLQLGPREDTIQLEMTRLGLQVWPALSFENQERLALNIRNALAIQRDKVFGLVRELRKDVLICNALPDEPALEPICAKLDLR